MIDQGAAAAELLASYGRFTLRPGLSDSEIAGVEKEFGFSFADDHRAFLAAALPVGRGWPDWRDGDRGQLRERLALPVEGVLFDVAENGFWYEGWGPCPESAADAVVAARRLLVIVPRLIPVYSHRYLPAGHGTCGHPVLSVMQTDIISYGANLTAYLGAEFGGVPAEPGRASVAFWRDLVG
ncbi:hypothetical protein ACFQFC_31960 [Amorphoplanes digitatis]|uniref:Knr4/Smi1-like domain-containing protein n=1 Tax=Actinoplanes digitatis TaxID=1868 RepID=A0A7W7HU44_9ACTN|nr:hypothetical protein [Actinoplanes digitatis]MBB4760769.1 hypothetical protein [Actinoplanes digitatis]GID94208.1 hypothetical protein Adi01nite_36200 [Actinoplanes digitatis]